MYGRLPLFHCSSYFFPLKNAFFDWLSTLITVTTVSTASAVVTGEEAVKICRDLLYFVSYYLNWCKFALCILETFFGKWKDFRLLQTDFCHRWDFSLYLERDTLQYERLTTLFFSFLFSWFVYWLKEWVYECTSDACESGTTMKFRAIGYQERSILLFRKRELYTVTIRSPRSRLSFLIGWSDCTYFSLYFKFRHYHYYTPGKF